MGSTANDLPDFTVVDIKEARCDVKSNSSEAFEKVDKSACDNNDERDSQDDDNDAKLEDVMQGVGYCRQQLDGQLVILKRLLGKEKLVEENKINVCIEQIRQICDKLPRQETARKVESVVQMSPVSRNFSIAMDASTYAFEKL